PGTPVGFLDYLSAAEKSAIIAELDLSAIAYDVDETVVSLFEKQVQQTPGNVAVKSGDVSLTYNELNEQANRFADYLIQQHGIAKEDLVAVKLEKSEWMIISLLGILKACAAYVPVDPAYPQDRIEYMIADSHCKLVIDENEIQSFKRVAQTYSAANHGEQPLPSNLAYVIYTSGTTGMPKGSLIEHGNLTRLFKPHQPLFEFGADDVWTMFHSFCFDFSVWEMYGALLFGGKLIMVPPDVSKDPARYLDLLISEGVTVLNQTPSSFYNIIRQELERIEASLKLRYVIFGGEALSPVKLKEFEQRYPATELINMYGITETTVHVTYKKITRREIENNSGNIGKPIPTLCCYVLDANRQLLPYGVPGELYVGGKGVCRGYLNRPDLTALRFVGDPFSKQGKLYRSGDKARLLETGELQYEGRIDDQVKVRGYRIELGEIQSLLAAHEQVESSVVITRDNETGEKELIAYIVSKGALNVSGLRRHLGKQLPSYMLPHYFIEVKEIPLTSNGKVDTKRLPAVTSDVIDAGVIYVAPANELEAGMCAIWQQVLGRDKIGTTESFFELGGDSIKVLRMLTAAKKELGLNLSVNDVYRRNTIEELVRHYAAHESEITQNERLLQEGRSVIKAQIEALKNEILELQDDAVINNIEDIYPMSDIEKGMIYESLMHGNAGIYNCLSVQRKIFESFDIEKFRIAVQLMTEKHPVLRSGFNTDDYHTQVQIVYKNINVPVEYIEISSSDAAQQTAIIRGHLEKLQQTPFNFQQPPLWSMTVFNVGGNEIVFVFQAHHSIVDGWSVASFTTELNNVYLELQRDPRYRPRPLQSNYKDFIIQHELDKTNEAVKDFWKNELTGFERLDVFSNEETKEDHAAFLPAEVLQRVKSRAQEWNTTVKIISLGAYAYMMKVLGLTDEVVIGLVTNTRPACEDGDKIIGCFLNTIPLRINIEKDQTAAGFINALQAKVSALKAYETLSTMEIATLHNEQHTGNPFFDVLFNYVDFHAYESIINNPAADNNIPKVEAGILGNYGSANTYFDFTVDASGENYLVDVLLRRKLKSELSAERIANLYHTILSFLVDFPNQLLHQVELTNTVEKQRLLIEFNNTQADFPKDRTIVNLFEEAAEKCADKAAVVFDDSVFTYGDLNEQSNQLADYLRKNYEILSNELIGIQLPRSQWMIVSILAILKAGGGYVPIDPEYPQERIDYLVSDSGCRMVITEQEIAIFLQQQDLYQKESLAVFNKPTDLAYVIYTSGSTGKPKGVMIEHRSVINLITAQRSRFGIDDSENILQFSSISFDASVEQIFLALTSGATLTIPSKEVITDAEQLRNFIVSHGITHIHTVPGILKDITAEKYVHLKRVIAGGDNCPKELAEKWSEYHSFFNEYGPTETTITSIEHLYGETNTTTVLPIGRPLANTFVYIINDGGHLVPMGVPGEICIGGAGLARGYLNRPELTAEKFVSNPFRPGEHMYRTGDLGRWLEDGTIEFIGRMDEQVKIRGYRIELGEIESVIGQYENVTAAVVSAINNGEERELIAYVVINGELNKASLREFLQAKLPAYMMPAHIVALEALPLTVNGKIDRKRLPAPSVDDRTSGREYIAPATEIEEKLLQIWSEVLGMEKEQISVNDNFFELGGHSLKATRLAGQLYRSFNVKLDLKELFIRAEIRQQALLIDQAIKSEFFSIAEAAPAESYPLSASQRRLWILSQFEAANAAYNIAGANVFEGNLDQQALSYSFSMLLSRHESLRTVFREDASGEARQVILGTKEIDFSINYRDVRGENDAELQIRKLVEEDFARPFDLSRGPLLRAGLYHVGEERWILSYVMHHIISDGWSMEVLIRELLLFYTSYVSGKAHGLKDLRIQYKDYSVWQQEQLSGASLQAHRSYWMEHFSGALPVVDLPSDKSRPAVKTYNGEIAYAAINAEAYKGLQSLSQQQGTTLFMSLLGLVNVLLYKYTGQEDIIIGSPVAVREHPDLEEQIGFYANTLALRTQFSGSDNFYELLDRVKKMTLGAYAHQVYPFDQLVGDLQLLRDRSRHPLFDIQVILQNDDDDAKAAVNGSTDLWMKQYPQAPVLASVFDIVFNFRESPDGLHIGITYNSDVYSRTLIDQLGKHLQQLTKTILDTPDASISSLDFLNDTERAELVKQDTEVAYSEHITLVSLFTQQVQQTPTASAVVCDSRSMSYAELDALSDRLAGYLKSTYSIGKDDKVGIMLDRSDNLIIAILAVLKSGAAYIPIDAQYPAARKEFILKDTAAQVLLTQTDHIFDLDYYSGAVFAIDVQLGMLDNSNALPEKEVDPESLAYVIYTSGSTGQPKGVMIAHSAIANTIQSQKSIFDVHPGYHHLQFASSSFDASVSEIFVALCSGGALYIISDEVKKDPQRFKQFVNDHQIDIATIPPA
ncbi:MAG: amino acid adenylation domain-containing protein, partial [Chitinophagaceae bacterium]